MDGGYKNLVRDSHFLLTLKTHFYNIVFYRFPQPQDQVCSLCIHQKKKRCAVLCTKWTKQTKTQIVNRHQNFWQKNKIKKERRQIALIKLEGEIPYWVKSASANISFTINGKELVQDLFYICHASNSHDDNI